MFWFNHQSYENNLENIDFSHSGSFFQTENVENKYWTIKQYVEFSVPTEPEDTWDIRVVHNLGYRKLWSRLSVEAGFYI